MRIPTARRQKPPPSKEMEQTRTQAYFFKPFQALVADAAAAQELREITQAIRAENRGLGGRVSGFPTGFTPSASFRFTFDYDDDYTRDYVLDKDTGAVRVARADEIPVSPELEERILRFLTNHARARSSHAMRRHALAAFGRENPLPPAPAAAAGAGVGGRRRRATRRKSKSRAGTRRRLRHRRR